MKRVKEFLFGGRYMNEMVSAVTGQRYRPFHGRGWQQRCLRFTIIVEIGHSVIGLYVLASAAGHFALGDWLSGVRSLGLNMLVNVYPVMVQRYNRARLMRILDLEARRRELTA